MHHKWCHRKVYMALLDNTLKFNERMEKPCQIFESGLLLTPNPHKVVMAKWVNHPISISSRHRSQMPALACCRARGYDHLLSLTEIWNSDGWGTRYVRSFVKWTEVHTPFLACAPPTHPLLVLLDSQYQPNIIRKAEEEQVLVFCLPPNTSYMTQPVDSSCFGALKTVWVDECHRFNMAELLRYLSY